MLAATPKRQQKVLSTYLLASPSEYPLFFLEYDQWTEYELHEYIASSYSMQVARPFKYVPFNKLYTNAFLSMLYSLVNEKNTKHRTVTHSDTSSYAGFKLVEIELSIAYR